MDFRREVRLGGLPPYLRRSLLLRRAAKYMRLAAAVGMAAASRDGRRRMQRGSKLLRK
ncbi:MAG: hypothetical protein IPM59_06110 [Chloracidobacterium sp.]|nr:hypothetical protein [Chloracidobacterium sp.]